MSNLRVPLTNGPRTDARLPVTFVSGVAETSVPLHPLEKLHRVRRHTLRTASALNYRAFDGRERLCPTTRERACCNRTMYSMCLAEGTARSIDSQGIERTASDVESGRSS